MHNRFIESKLTRLGNIVATFMNMDLSSSLQYSQLFYPWLHLLSVNVPIMFLEPKSWYIKVIFPRPKSAESVILIVYSGWVW